MPSLIHNSVNKQTNKQINNRCDLSNWDMLLGRLPQYSFYQFTLLVVDKPMLLYTVQVDNEDTFKGHVLVEILEEKG